MGTFQDHVTHDAPQTALLVLGRCFGKIIGFVRDIQRRTHNRTIAQTHQPADRITARQLHDFVVFAKGWRAPGNGGTFLFLLVEIVGQNHCLGKIPHGTAQTTALVAETEVSLLFT